MARTFGSPAAFRKSLEARLKHTAAARGIALNSLRLKVVIERLLARLFNEPDPPWLLKGGFAMELRFRPKARTTKDVDLAVVDGPAGDSPRDRLDGIRESLQVAADIDLGDYLDFRIAAARQAQRRAVDSVSSDPTSSGAAGFAMSITRRPERPAAT